MSRVFSRSFSFMVTKVFLEIIALTDRGDLIDQS